MLSLIVSEQPIPRIKSTTSNNKQRLTNKTPHKHEMFKQPKQRKTESEHDEQKYDVDQLDDTKVSI